jgi:hypothetical protein
MQVRPNEPVLAGAFRKDPADEAFLGELNHALAEFEDASYEDFPEAYPTLHVIGAPRSGTTLLYQVLASGLDVGYVNNLVAAFWRAPVTGLRLARKLGLDRLESSFDSSFGRTAGVSEPHEFGYFWNYHLGYPDLAERDSGHEATIDWGRLARVIVNMSACIDKPISFKPMLLIWHLEALARTMPRTCYVWIRRERRDTALSLLKMRRSLRGTEHEWASLRPAAVSDDDPPWRQVAAQVVLLERRIARAADALGPDRVLQVHYDELCSAPMAVLERARDLLGGQGHAPELRIDRLEPFVPQRNPGLESELGERVDEALEDIERALPEVADE